ncbi:MAG: 23S rRNA (pseudouridine1915-N3)-methyltransferase [Flavobacteriales bacterium]
MRLFIVAVGRVRDKNMRALIDEYAKRMTRYGKLTVVEVKEAKSAPDRATAQRQESEALLRACPASAVRVALDERGVEWSSAAFAAALEAGAVAGRGDWAFLLGGAEGHSDELRAQCKHVWSLSRLTFPHEQCRLMLIEQLYRAQTIRAGEKYHREG